MKMYNKFQMDNETGMSSAAGRRRMKLFLVMSTLFALPGCIDGPYAPPASGPTATLNVSTKNSVGIPSVTIVEKRAANVFQNGGLFHVGDLLNGSSTETTTMVPANILIMLTYVARIYMGGIHVDGCGVQFQYVPEENAVYRVQFWDQPISEAHGTFVFQLPPGEGASVKCFSKIERIWPDGHTEIVSTQNP